jgi:inosine/xanthosine triphosphate pyrophosphatase family protein
MYVTSSTFKREENRVFTSECSLLDGASVGDLFRFQLQHLDIKEVLEVRLEAMVSAEVKAAYARLRVPCIVEHAGLIFEDYADQSYPGGLTKPMWNTLGDKFIIETHSAGRRAIAKAVVAYCDGMSVHTFIGETNGILADAPRGERHFYWDTVFIPDDDNPGRLTYAEIAADPDLGLAYKVARHSQSSKAMLSFLEWRRTHEPSMWQIPH